MEKNQHLCSNYKQNQMKKKIIKFLIDIAKRNKLIQSIFEQPIDLTKFSQNGTFTDKHNNQHILYSGLRSKLKPGWEKIFQFDGKTMDKSPKTIEKIVQNGRISVNRMEPIIDLFSQGIKNSAILEIGCSTAGTTYAFANKGAKTVTGTEFSGYKIKSMHNKEIDKNELMEVNSNLKEIRNLVKNKFNLSSEVTFKDDDICNSTLPDNSYDIICSWDVLEHIHDPLSAFKNIHRLLKKGGIAVHEYNPFFSLIGGHSACTIDFLWGHVILDAEDFEKYNDTIQPDKKEISMSFYENGINRMTINDIINYSAEAGLEILSLIIYPKEQHLRMLNQEILKYSQENYPNLTVNDLISPKIIIVHKKH